MPLKIYYPFKPYFITQPWGNPNAAYAQQFSNPDFKRHNGVDATNHGTALPGQTWPVYCPVEDFHVESVMYEGNGGGNELSLVSNHPLQMGDKLCHARIFLCHAKKILVREGENPKLGELLMVANNTGFSTGPHTHMGLYRIDDQGNKLDTNDSTGSYDPAIFFTGEYAVDKASLTTLVISGLKLVRYYAGL